MLGVLASIAPAQLVERMDTIIRRMATTIAQHSDTELLELGARDAVARIRSGDLSAEAYVTRLLRQNDRCVALNFVTALDADRVKEAARAVDVARARGAKPGPAAGLPFGGFTVFGILIGIGITCALVWSAHDQRRQRRMRV